MKTLTPDEVRALLSRLQKGLREVYGDRLREVVWFGSTARGEASSDSDIDVAVILDRFEDHWTEIKKSEVLVSDLSLEFGVSLSLIRIREKDWRERETPLLMNLREEGIRL